MNKSPKLLYAAIAVTAVLAAGGTAAALQVAGASARPPLTPTYVPALPERQAEMVATRSGHAVQRSGRAAPEKYKAPPDDSEWEDCPHHGPHWECDGESYCEPYTCAAQRAGNQERALHELFDGAQIELRSY